MPTRDDNPLVRAVARLPTTVRGKVVGAFLGIVALIMVVGVLGLRVLGASNDRVETLGNLQQRLVAYRVLKTDIGQLQLLLALRTAVSDEVNIYVGASPSSTPGSPAVGPGDDHITSTIKLLGPLTDAAALDFKPPDDEKMLIDQIHREYGHLSATVTRIVALDQAGKTSEGRQLQATDADRLRGLAAPLRGRCRGQHHPGPSARPVGVLVARGTDSAHERAAGGYRLPVTSLVTSRCATATSSVRSQSTSTV